MLTEATHARSPVLWFRSAAALNVSFVPRLLLILLSHLASDVNSLSQFLTDPSRRPSVSCKSSQKVSLTPGEAF